MSEVLQTKGRSALKSKVYALSICVASLANTPAFADSCWMHNGSVMRLAHVGSQRIMTYEVPRPALAQIGVFPGQILFEGYRAGNTISGQARIFSTECQGEERIYSVSGQVSANVRSFTLVGSRPIYRNCVPTGRAAQDRLVFTFLNDC
jgi:hypothetical protein